MKEWRGGEDRGMEGWNDEQMDGQTASSDWYSRLYRVQG